MLWGNRVAVVLPAYNAEKTLRDTFAEIPAEIVDTVLLVDDASRDDTVQIAKELGIQTIRHDRNRGYGANQKTCYREALATDCDIFIMVHPDYQYTPRLIPAMASMLISGEYDLVLGSRILGGKARSGGMPLYKYAANRMLTLFENLMLRAKLSEYHTGYRGFTRQVLERLPLEENSDDFLFDNQILAQAIYFGFRVGEISCPTRYFDHASSINFPRSVRYGLGVVETALLYRLEKWGLFRSSIFDPAGRRLSVGLSGKQQAEASAAGSRSREKC